MMQKAGCRSGATPYCHTAWCDLQEDELKKAGKLQGGVLTPASAMGMLLVDRLNEAGMDFRVESDTAIAEE